MIDLYSFCYMRISCLVENIRLMYISVTGHLGSYSFER